MYIPIDIKRSSKYGSSYWETYSPKLGRIIKLISDLQYDNWVLVETDSLIKTYCERPQINERSLETMFDMWVLYKNGTETFINIRYTPRNKYDPLEQNTVKQKEWCQAKGCNYLLRTDKEIRGNLIYLGNMKMILSFMKNLRHPTEFEISSMKTILSEGKSTIRNIHREIHELSSSRIMEVIAWMFYQGYIFANLNDFVLNLETEVRLNHEQKGH